MQAGRGHARVHKSGSRSNMVEEFRERVFWNSVEAIQTGGSGTWTAAATIGNVTLDTGFFRVTLSLDGSKSIFSSNIY